jgi:hypothetical protein
VLKNKKHDLVPHYPQIWAWGIVWFCKSLNKFCLCNCFEEYIDALFYRIRKRHRSYSSSSSSFSIFAHNFPSEFINSLIGKNVATTVYHTKQPIFEFNENGREIGAKWFESFMNVQKFDFLDGICHVCSPDISDHYFCGDAYGSEFKQRYGAYFYRKLFKWGLTGIYRDEELIPNHIREKYFKNIKIPELGRSQEFDKAMGELERALENEIRERLDYPLIGEGWVQETLLFNLIRKIFPNYEIIHHYFPEFLGGQELDIFIEDLNLGIEYQGQQHFEPIEFFGGIENFEKLVERDKRKEKLCKEYKIPLLYFDYKEELTQRYVQDKINKFLND